MASNISQHKRLAMGQPVNKMAMGGSVPRATPSVGSQMKGAPMNPLTKSRHSNGVPGMKKGGKC